MIVKSNIHILFQDVTVVTLSSQIFSPKHDLPFISFTELSCTNLTTTPSPDLQVCKWDYSGLGLEYQLLAGPSFIFVFTLMGMFWGYAADHLNRVWLLTAAAVMFSLSLVGASFATKYWHLVISRMFLAAG